MRLAAGADGNEDKGKIKLMAKQRLDMLLVERGLAGSRERAKRMIMAGEVLVDNQKVDKAGATVKAEESVCSAAIYPMSAVAA